MKRHLLISLVLLAACSLAAGSILAQNAGNGYVTKAGRMDRSRLNIGVYHLRPYARTEAHVKDLADCGVDFVICMDYDVPTLDLFRKYGVGAIVSGIVPGWWGGDGYLPLERDGEDSYKCTVSSCQGLLVEAVPSE